MSVHICVLTSVHQPFDGRIFYRESSALAQAGYQVTLVAPADFERREENNITILGVPRPNSRSQRPLVWWRLYRLVRRLRPDVVHFHDPELLLLAPLFRIAPGGDIKIIYDVHEYFIDSLADKYWIPAKLRPLVKFMARWLEKLLVRGVHGIVCVGEEQKSLYDGFRGPIAVVRNLPRASLFEGAEPHFALNADGLKLIYVGLILPKRGINSLLEAMRILRQQEEKDIHLFLIGPDTSPTYTQDIQTFIQTHELGNQVHLLGYIPHNQIKHYLANADVGMAPGMRTSQYSKSKRGIATKLFEYMLSGLPIISVDHPHRRGYIQEGNCGILVPFENASAYVDAILWLRDHPKERQEMGQRGRDMVFAHYTWEQEQKHLTNFYQALLSPNIEPQSEI